MGRNKKLSNPFSTGGGGGHFEASVQACFVTLMLTGGYAPALPRWPIVEVKLQGKVDGFETDDLIIHVQNPSSGERRKLLGQLKHAVAFTAGNEVLGQVLHGAWTDFNNSSVFSKGKDAITLITGPLSAIDQKNVCWLLEQARRTKDCDEFYRNVKQTNFSPSQAEEKLEVIASHLQRANCGKRLDKHELFEFFKHFHLLGFDLGSEAGVSLALLHSHMSQFNIDLPQWAWGRVIDVVQTWNRAAGTITLALLPEDLRAAFDRRAAMEFPKELEVAPTRAEVDWTHHPDASYLALSLLLGSWDEKNGNDTRVVSELLGIEYEQWVHKAREILHTSDSPLSLRDGTWTVSERACLWPALGSRLFDRNLDAFKTIARTVLAERDPAFELPAEERYAAGIHGKVTTYSPALRKGLAEGLALLGTAPEAATHCSRGKPEATCASVVRDVLTDADWVVWGSLSNLLPMLAEASPLVFLDAVERATATTPCVFDELFSQEGNGLTGANYLAGLLWALEGLAWDPDLLVRVSVALGDVASHDPGGTWTNRPSNSLVSILLPWMPQTLASIEKRSAAVRTLLTEQPSVGWNLLLQLLPDQHRISTGTHRPKWRKTIPAGWEKGVSRKEYADQTIVYANLAIAVAGSDPKKLAQLASRLDHLPRDAFDALLASLGSPETARMPEEQRREIWGALTKFARKHRRFSDAQWALPSDRVAAIEDAAKSLAPTSAFVLYQYLFNENDSDLFEQKGNWDSQREALIAKREDAVRKLMESGGVPEVLKFAEAVRSARQVGLALGALGDEQVDEALLPRLLGGPVGKHRALIDGYIWQRYINCGWSWCDHVVKPDWTVEDKALFLCELPFGEETWARAEGWLEGEMGAYWRAAQANPYTADASLTYAITKLLEFGRPNAAIECLSRLRNEGGTLDVDMVVRALLAAVATTEAGDSMDPHYVTELIKFLQSEPSVTEDDLFKVEWAYLPLLNSHSERRPELLERKLAKEPDFFCEVIRVLYRSTNKDASDVDGSQSRKAIALNAWRLLNDWSTPPGLQSDGSYIAAQLDAWLDVVKARCIESGHIDVALIQTGAVLIHVPPDPDGLWINRGAAAVLNARDAQHMRDGFRTAIFNSRGAHFVDPAAAPELELAAEYRRKAEEIENAGFQRFASMLRELAAGYEQDAQRIVEEYQDRSNGST